MEEELTKFLTDGQLEDLSKLAFESLKKGLFPDRKWKHRRGHIVTSYNKCAKCKEPITESYVLVHEVHPHGDKITVFCSTRCHEKKMKGGEL